MSWDTVIGLEVHVQLATKTKFFPAPALPLAPNPILKLAPLIWQCPEHCPYSTNRPCIMP